MDRVRDARVFYSGVWSAARNRRLPIPCDTRGYIGHLLLPPTPLIPATQHRTANTA